MSRYVLQWSEDSGTVWNDGGRGFTSIAKAKVYFDELASKPAFEWRVGFLLKLRQGTLYQLFDKKKGKPATLALGVK